MDQIKIPLLLLLACCTLGAQAARIELTNGDALSGRISAETDTAIQLEHPVLGSLRIDRAQIASLSNDGDQPTEDQPAAETPPDDGFLRSGYLTGWSRDLTVGINGAEGNASNAKLHLDLAAEMENETDRWAFRAAYDGKSEDGETTENSFFATLDKDWLLPDSRMFWFARGRFDWDDFQDWDYRLGGYLGPGYQFIDNGTWNLRGRLGAGGSQTWGGEDEGFTPELLLGLDIGWKISEQQSVKVSTTFYPDVDEFGEFRNISTLDWRINISDFYRGVALKIGLSNEYQSLVAASDEHYDFKYHMGLLMGL